MTTQLRDHNVFGRRLEHLRNRGYLTRAKLAQRSGVSKDQIQSLEQGRSANPTLRTLLQLASALQVPVAELIEGITIQQTDPSGAADHTPGGAINTPLRES
jgi:transcriptional regulator with XRE-family HTH domain